MTQSDRSRDRRTAAVPPAVERQIDENLQLLFRRQLEQGLPENLMALVARLREQAAASGPDTTPGDGSEARAER